MCFWACVRVVHGVSSHTYVDSNARCIGGRRRPYRVECTGSLQTSEVKRRRARLVLGWGTAREDLRVLSAFVFLVAVLIL